MLRSMSTVDCSRSSPVETIATEAYFREAAVCRKPSLPRFNIRQSAAFAAQRGNAESAFSGADGSRDSTGRGSDESPAGGVSLFPECPALGLPSTFASYEVTAVSSFMASNLTTHKRRRSQRSRHVRDRAPKAGDEGRDDDLIVVITRMRRLVGVAVEDRHGFRAARLSKTEPGLGTAERRGSDRIKPIRASSERFVARSTAPAGVPANPSSAGTAWSVIASRGRWLTAVWGRRWNGTAVE